MEFGGILLLVARTISLVCGGNCLLYVALHRRCADPTKLSAYTEWQIYKTHK